MSEATRRSAELSRRILYGDKGITLALEQNRSLKIGWPGGEAKPRSGDLGFAPGLPANLTMRYLGVPGSFSFALNQANVSIEGNARSFIGAWMIGGKITIEGSTDTAIGYAMQGGQVTIEGDVSGDTGLSMEGGRILIMGSAGPNIGNSMQGGMILVKGSVGANPGINMQGGCVLINGKTPRPGPGAMQVSPDEWLEQLDDELREEFADAVALVPSDGERLPTRLPLPVTGEWTSIIPVCNDQAPRRQPDGVDTITLIEGVEDRPPLGLRASIIQANGKPGHGGPVLDHERSEPRICTLTPDQLREPDPTADVLLDLDRLPSLDDEALDGLIALLQSQTEEDRRIILVGGVGDLPLLQRTAGRGGIHAGALDMRDAEGRPATSLLPIFGRTAAAFSEEGIPFGAWLPWTVRPEDVLTIAASGGSFAVGEVEGEVDQFAMNLRRKLLETGTRALNELDRSHLRATDAATANLTGLRLAGYERPMPHWLRGGS